jgi:cyclohexadienyl dehydratase
MVNIKILIFLSYFILISNNSFYTKIRDYMKHSKSNNRILKVGTTGDYKPVSFYNKTTNTYEGIDIELSELYAKEHNLELSFVPTTWPTLLEDTLNNNFDFAISGITITDKRKQVALMTDGYLTAGKTFLMRKEDVDKYKSIKDVNRPNVRVMINPGGTNEQFALENLKNANITVHQVNEEIPGLISKEEADIMVTEVMEGLVYIKEFDNLAVPLYKTPFTDNPIGILLNKNKKDLWKELNKWLALKRNDGTIERIKQKYIPYPN